VVAVAAAVGVETIDEDHRLQVVKAVEVTTPP
jgi:hypothetical protein